MKYGERLKAALEFAKSSDPKKTQAWVAEFAGTSQANISALTKGDATGSEFTCQFAAACGVCPLWLSTGKGDMDVGLYVKNKQLQSVVKIMEPFKPYEVEIAVKEIVAVVEHISALHEHFKKEK